MKIGYYHYYFKEVKKRKAPRICHDIRPMLKAYLKYSDQSWKSQIRTTDGEELLLLNTPKSDVFMLVATRKQEIIKAIHKHTLSCVELSERLKKDESAGFAAYFSADGRSIGLASTLRGPRTTAFSSFVNTMVERLGGSRWKMHLHAIGSAITVDQAKAMAFVSRSSVHVSGGNPLFKRIKELLGTDSDDIGSFEVIIRGRKKKNIADVFEQMAAEAEGDGMDRMKIRAKAVAGEALADYFVDEYGKMSDDLGTGSEKKMIQEVSRKFHGHHSLNGQVEEILENNHYESKSIPELDRLGKPDFWNNHLQGDMSSADG
jgi:hypothetical protein